MFLHSVNNSISLGWATLHWSVAAIIGLMIGSLALMGLLTGPLARRPGRGVAAPVASA
jgi:hypothetical protein